MMAGLSLGMWILITGSLFALLGVLLLFNHGTIATIVIGILLLVSGLCGAKVGYDLDQTTEVSYKVTEVITFTEWESNNHYRVGLKNLNTDLEIWIYVPEENIYLFTKGATVTMTKQQIKQYSEQNLAAK